MEIERELERVIEKNKNRQYSTFETRVDLVAQDCLQEIHRLKDVVEFFQNQEGWISVEDETPDLEKRVMICTETRHNGEAYKHIVMGMYENGTVWSEDSAFNWEDLDTYDEEQDDYLIPEGWYEYSLYREDGVNSIDDFVTHWMPLPKPPKEVKI